MITCEIIVALFVQQSKFILVSKLTITINTISTASLSLLFIKRLPGSTYVLLLLLKKKKREKSKVNSFISDGCSSCVSITNIEVSKNIKW